MSATEDRPTTLQPCGANDIHTDIPGDEVAWPTAGHVSHVLDILTVSKWRRARDWLILWSGDLLFANRQGLLRAAILNAEKTMGTRLSLVPSLSRNATLTALRHREGPELD